MSIFGFSTEPSQGGDFTPHVRYDARSGHIHRIDRVETAGEYKNSMVDITTSFKAIFDLEHVEVGYMEFAPGSTPSLALVPMGSELPPRPSPKHKPGVRLMIKLSKDCGGDKPIRELSGTAKAFVGGVEQAYLAYQAGNAANPGKLPVMVLKTTKLIKSGKGEKASTNYQPVFEIVGWTPRGDLTFVPKATPTNGPQPQAAQSNDTPPSTGSTRAPPPSQQQGFAADDFG